MILLIGNNVHFLNELGSSFARWGLATTAQRFGDDSEYGAAAAFVVHLDGDGANAFADRLDFSRQLHHFHPQRPIYALTDNPSQADARSLLAIDWAGIHPPRWGPAMLIDCIRRQLPAQVSHPDRQAQVQLSDGGWLTLKSGKSLRLTERQRGVMALLMRNAGTVVDREEILQVVWQRELDFDVRTVDSTISRLRRRAREQLGIEHLVRTIAGRGYVYHETSNEPNGADDPAFTLTRLLAIGFQEESWSRLEESARQFGIPASRWTGAAMPGTGNPLLLVRASTGARWLPQLRAALRHNSESPTLIFDHGAKSNELRRAIKQPRVHATSLQAPERTLSLWLPWALRRFGAHFSTTPARLELAPDALGVRFQGTLVPLPPKDYAVLALLYDFADRPVPRERLRLQVWGGALPVDSRSIDMRVSKLRKVLARHFGQGPPCIETINGYGYRLRLSSSR